MNAPTHQGIDGVYYKLNGHPPYIIGEAKYGSSKLGSTKDGMQMSDTWINGSNRLVNAVGKDVADDILLEGYGRILVNITSDGKVIIKKFGLRSKGIDMRDKIKDIEYFNTFINEDLARVKKFSVN